MVTLDTDSVGCNMQTTSSMSSTPRSPVKAFPCLLHSRLYKTVPRRTITFGISIVFHDHTQQLLSSTAHRIHHNHTQQLLSCTAHHTHHNHIQQLVLYLSRNQHVVFITIILSGLYHNQHTVSNKPESLSSLFAFAGAGPAGAQYASTVTSNATLLSVCKAHGLSLPSDEALPIRLTGMHYSPRLCCHRRHAPRLEYPLHPPPQRDVAFIVCMFSAQSCIGKGEPLQM